jgi:hypothetical protein
LIRLLLNPPFLKGEDNQNLCFGNWEAAWVELRPWPERVLAGDAATACMLRTGHGEEVLEDSHASLGKD